jgi:hypothetical protein
MSRLRSLLAAALLLSMAAAASADTPPATPVNGSAPPPGYTAPQLIGVQGEQGKSLRIRPISFPDIDEPWVRAQSAHFVILSSAGETRTRQMAEGLETLAAALTKFAPAIAANAATPTRVLVFTRRREVQPYFDYLLNREGAHASGVFVSQKNGGSMIVDAGWGKLPSDRTPFHELVHSLLAAGEKHLPLWLEEGLAEYYSAADLRKGSLYVGAPLREHVAVLRAKRVMPLADIFGVVRESDAYNLPSGQSMFYSESWAAVDVLMRAAGKERAPFYAFVRDLDGGTPVAAALQSRFGMTVAELEQQVRAYGGTFRIATGSSLPVPDVDRALTMNRLERDDLLYELGTFLRGINAESGEAKRHFEEALRFNRKHARSLAALGRYDEAIAADPADAEIYLTYAETLLGTEIGALAEAGQPEEKQRADFAKARQLAAHAIELVPSGGADEARARGDFGASFVMEPDAALGPAIEALRRAHTLAPGRTDFAVHLFAFLRRSGEKAQALFEQLLAARNKQVAFAARAIVVRTELARANTLTHADRLDDAAQVIRDLAAGTEDLDVRHDLERQAGELARVAVTNKEIGAFNQAVAETNAGKYSAARKTLTALLAQAKDTQVIRDAKKLQKELAGRRDLGK